MTSNLGDDNNNSNNKSNSNAASVTLNNNKEKDTKDTKDILEELTLLYSRKDGKVPDSWTSIDYIFKYSNSPPIVDFVVSKLYQIEDKDIDFYITQLCILLINQHYDQKATLSSLAKFIMDRCAKSMRFAIKSYWIFQAFEEDGMKSIEYLQQQQYQQQQQQQQHDISTTSSPKLTSSTISSSTSLSSSPLHSNTLKLNMEINIKDKEVDNNNTEEKQEDKESINNNNVNNNHHNNNSEETTKLYVNGIDLNNNNCSVGNNSTILLLESRMELATRLREYCEMSVITLSRPQLTRPRTSSLPSPIPMSFSSTATTNTTTSTLLQPEQEEILKQTTLDMEFKGLNISQQSPQPSSSSPNQQQQQQQQIPLTNMNIKETSLNIDTGVSLIEKSKTPPIEITTHQQDYDFELEISKSYRCDYLNSILSFVQKLDQISKKLINVVGDLRQAKLKNDISSLNINLPLGLYLPLFQTSLHHCIVRIPPEEVKILNSRERVPFLLVLEIIDSQEEAAAANILKIVSSYLPQTLSNKQNTLKLDIIKKHIIGNQINNINTNNNNNQNNNQNNNNNNQNHSPVIEKALISHQEKQTPFGELWSEKTERYRAISPYGHLPNWRLVSVIVKTGDDCRQEQMAVQMIQKFQEIWKAAKLPLFLRPYAILVTSAQSGIIETIPDTISLHNLKKNTPNYTTMLQHFKNMYGESTLALRQAQENFVESLAAYSIVTYLLQIKDRHNGNILLDSQGHIIHIDFGFILSNTPGNISFESAPFKLTQDWLDVMGGNYFHYFQALCVRGFLEARKHWNVFVDYVELMMSGPKMSCFQGGASCIDQLKQRFMLHMSDRECSDSVEQMITYSLDHRATRYYDYYQYYYNGVYG